MSMNNPDKLDFNWFPGHMMKALREIKKRVTKVDIILEVRDARVPFSTGNDAFIEQIGRKNRLLVMNKANLSLKDQNKKWQQRFEKEGLNVIFVNGLDKKALADVVKKARKVIFENTLQSNPDAKPKEMIKMMVIGLPNTGKSTIINKLSGRDASKVADKPGQTRQQLWVQSSKQLMILDTPGIMPPVIKTKNQLNWLSIVHAIPAVVYDIHHSVVYLLDYLLRNNLENLNNHYKIELTPKHTPEQALEVIGQKRGCLRKGAELDIDRVYQIVFGDFRSGKLGLATLERTT